MKKSEFLTNIAQGYNSKIETVFFCNEKRLPDGAWGVANAQPNLEWYRILLNDKLLSCPIRALGVLFHELGHIVLNHFYSVDTESEERAAIEWAFREMGTIDQEGKIKKENSFCYVCISLYSKLCLKKFHDQIRPQKSRTI